MKIAKTIAVSTILKNPQPGDRLFEKETDKEYHEVDSREGERVYVTSPMEEWQERVPHLVRPIEFSIEKFRKKFMHCMKGIRLEKQEEV